MDWGTLAGAQSSCCRCDASSGPWNDIGADGSDDAVGAGLVGRDMLVVSVHMLVAH